MIHCVFKFVFFFKQKTAYEVRISDWSSDVCSSDLEWGSGQRSFNHPHFYIGSVRDQAKFIISSCCAGRRTARFPTSGRPLEPGPAARNFATVDYAYPESAIL